jgi:diguanylate cyclase (GGDEF)-like protein
MKNIQVLFVDDEISVLSSLERYLITEPYGKHFISSPEKALEFMGEFKVDVVVSDMKMPGMDGLTFLRRVKETYPNTVRMVLSGYSEIAQIIPCINTGEIFRYVSKPIEPPEFKALLMEAVELSLMKADKQDLTRRLTQSYIKLKETTQAFERLSLTDDLTGLYNTRFIYRDLKNRDLNGTDNTGPDQPPLSIAFLDINRFKTVVDQYGHIDASRILAALGREIKQRVKPPCYAATFGGDLFILVLPGLDRSAGLDAVRTLKSDLEQINLGNEIKAEVSLTLTHGLGTCPDDSPQPSCLLGVADQDLARNKKRRSRPDS